MCYSVDMAQKLETIPNTKDNTMDNKNNDDFDFEIVDPESVQFAKRGRKSNVDPKLIEALTKLPKGKSMKIGSMKVDTKASTFRTDKARISAQIRTACANANLKNFQIRWSTDGVPFVEALAWHKHKYWA